MASFDEDDLVRRLGRAPARARVAFACACSSRMLSPYRQALSEVGGDRSDLLSAALGHLWAYALGGPSLDWSTWAERLIEQIPPENEMAGSASKVLDDALAAAAYAARAAIATDAADAARSARRLYDAVDAYAQRSLTFTEFTPEIERALSQHPAVQQELERQARDLAELEAEEAAAVVFALRERARNEAAF